MLKRVRTSWSWQTGDTLIEVTFALSILGFVLLGATATAASAFRMGQTARERTTISQEAQEQMEALRSFRDNNDWGTFENGDSGCGGSGICGVKTAAHGACVDGSFTCFHMAQTNPACSATPSCNQWAPVSGALNFPAGGLTVPTSIVEIEPVLNVAMEPCAFDFVAHYSFEPLGGIAKQTNEIATRLVNLKYVKPGIGPSACPNS